MTGDRRVHATLLGVAVSVYGIPAPAGIPSHRHEGSGVTYDYRAVSVLKSTSTNDTGRTVELSGVVSFAGGRGRLQVARSTYPGVVPGDYCLFDSTGSIVVRPSSRVFFVVAGAGHASGLTNTTKVTDVTSRIEAIGKGDTVDGRETGHYRSRIGYTVTFSELAGSVGQQTVSATWVTDYWVAVSAEMAGGEFSQPSLFQMSSPGDAFDGVRKRMRRARDSIGAMGMPLKTVSVVTTRGADGTGVSVRSTIWISRLKTASVDLHSLVLPHDFAADTGTLRGPPSAKQVVRFRKLPQGARSN